MTELNFTREIEQPRAEPAWQEFDRNAKRLVKNPELRVVLMTLKTGARLEKHVAPGASSIQGMAGHVRLNLPSESAELAAGELVAVAPAIRHDLEALETSAILLTIVHSASTMSPAARRCAFIGAKYARSLSSRKVHLVFYGLDHRLVRRASALRSSRNTRMSVSRAPARLASGGNGPRTE